MGVMRVGALARGLMLQGERQMEVVLMMKSMCTCCVVCVCMWVWPRICMCACTYVEFILINVIVNDTGKPTKEVLQRIVNLLPDKLTVHIIYYGLVHMMAYYTSYSHQIHHIQSLHWLNSQLL